MKITTWRSESPKTSILRVYIVAASLLAALLSNGCTNNVDQNGPLAGSGQMEKTTIFGRVVDESGMGLPGVTVSAGTASAITDSKGLYLIRDASVPKGRAVIIAKKAGFFDGARAEKPGSKGSTRMELSMMANTASYSVSASSGGTVTIASSGGASVAFMPGSFLNSDGTPYSGTVKVAARYLNPSASNFYNFFDGDNEAQRTDGSSTMLVSCGVLRVELSSTGGQALKLDPTKPATLTCPKPADPLAPSTIQLWSFDESLGMWKEEGVATLSGNFYSGTVTHFTDYNFDYCGVENGELQFRIVCNGVAVEGVTAEVLGRKVTTGPDGMISIRRVAADGRAVTIEVLSADNGGAFFTSGAVSVTMVPNQVNDAGDISLSSDCPAAIFGSMTDCGDASKDGLVILSDGTNFRYAYTKNGSFGIQCQPNVGYDLYAIDGDGNQSSTISVPALSSGEQRTIGVVKICGTGAATYFDINIGSTTKSESMAICGDGSRLAVVSYQPAAISIYDTKNGSVVSTISVTPNTYVYNMQFTPDGTKLLALSYNDASIYDVTSATATKVCTIAGATISSASIYDDGSKVLGVVGHGSTSTVDVFSGADGSLLSETHPTNVNDSSAAIGFIRDENNFMYWDKASGGTFRVWSIANDAEVRNFAGPGNGYSTSYSEDGLSASTSSNYKDYTAYDSKSSSSIGTFTSIGINGVRYGSILITKSQAYATESSSGATVIRIIQFASGASTIKILPNGSNVSSLAASRDESTLAACAGSAIRIWKLK